LHATESLRFTAAPTATTARSTTLSYVPHPANGILVPLYSDAPAPLAKRLNCTAAAGEVATPAVVDAFTTVAVPHWTKAMSLLMVTFAAEMPSPTDAAGEKEPRAASAVALLPDAATKAALGAVTMALVVPLLQ
jgi:hypothetical protein